MTLKQHKLTDYPLGEFPKLNELMVLVAVSAATDSGNGYDLNELRRQADHATKLWEEHQASIPTEATGDEVERVARAIDPHAFADPTGDSYAEKRVEQAYEKARAAIASLSPNRVSQSVVERHVAAILEEWDMKEPPNSYTGHSYEEIAKDIVARAALATQPATDTRIPINEEATGTDRVSNDQG